jgi:hypothetical protein
LIEVLQEFVGCQLDFLVPPLGCAVVAGNKPHAVQPAEVAVDERVAGLCLVWSAFGKAEMPGGVLVPRVFRYTFCSSARGCTFCQRDRSTYWRASISRFACLTATSFTM